MTLLRALSPRRLSAIGVIFAGLLVPRTAPPVDPSLYSGLVWRNIGPFRAGRVSAVTGVIGQPGVFYMGLPLGGVWKTTSAGMTWFPIFDDVKDVSSIGAIEVAPSNPNIIYVGTGDLITGGGINEGNGIYKSTDAGKTWQHIGLDEHAADSHDPRRSAAIPTSCCVAAQGNVHAETDTRGVYRSTDGGRTWNAHAVRRQPHRRPEASPARTIIRTWCSPPRVQHYTPPGATRPWRSRRRRGGVPRPPSCSSRTDEGVTWKELTGGGLPSLTGRTSVAVAMHTNAQRMFLIGAVRPLPLGRRRRHVARRIGDRRSRGIAGQRLHRECTSNSKNPDIVYTIATSVIAPRRRRDVPRLQGRAGRRRSARALDRSDRRQPDVPRRRPGRDDHARRRRHLEPVVQPADGAGLPHLDRQLVPVLDLR